MKITQTSSKDPQYIAKIHVENFKNAFLCDLGFSFLKLLYDWILRLDKGFGYVIKDNNNEIIGFITGVYDSSNLVSSFIKNNFLKTMPILILNFIKKPKNIKKVFETVFYSKKSDINIKAELLSIAIEKNFRSKGHSQELFSYFIDHLKKRNIKIFKITVDKDNLAANKFYIKIGCKLVKSYKMYGKFSNIYRYEIK